MCNTDEEGLLNKIHERYNGVVYKKDKICVIAINKNKTISSYVTVKCDKSSESIHSNRCSKCRIWRRRILDFLRHSTNKRYRIINNK